MRAAECRTSQSISACLAVTQTNMLVWHWPIVQGILIQGSATLWEVYLFPGLGVRGENLQRGGGEGGLRVLHPSPEVQPAVRRAAPHEAVEGPQGRHLRLPGRADSGPAAPRMSVITDKNA